MKIWEDRLSEYRLPLQAAMHFVDPGGVWVNVLLIGRGSLKTGTTSGAVLLTQAVKQLGSWCEDFKCVLTLTDATSEVEPEADADLAPANMETVRW